jgi:hypothetical protein
VRHRSSVAGARWATVMDWGGRRSMGE